MSGRDDLPPKMGDWSGRITMAESEQAPQDEPGKDQALVTRALAAFEERTGLIKTMCEIGEHPVPRRGRAVLLKACARSPAMS